METQTETQSKEQNQKITKDTMIADVLTQNPKHSVLLTDIMTGFGIHCVGCGAATFETLEQGMLGHGFTDEQLNKLITDLNRAIEENPVESNPTPESAFDIIFTPTALTKVRETMKQRGKENSTLRVAVQAGGCSGFLYDLSFIDNPSTEDLNMKKEEVNIAIDKGSLNHLNGVQVDFVDTLNESGFKFSNPNASAGCGCGKSFN